LAWAETITVEPYRQANNSIKCMVIFFIVYKFIM
jgi:hypothetical protein